MTLLPVVAPAIHQAAQSAGLEQLPWKEISESLAAILGGILAFIGRRVVRTVDGFDDKLDKVSERVRKWNDDFQRTLSEQGVRITDVEDRVEGWERRRKPR